MAAPSDLFRQQVTISEARGRDAAGRPELGPLEVVAARVQPMRRLIRDTNGNEHLASHVIYTVAAVTLRHRLWLPGEDISDINRARRIAVVDELVDGRGVTRFRKVWL
jgi:hypothetical protein